MRRRQSNRHDGPAHLRALRHLKRSRCDTRHGVVVMLVAQPRRRYPYSPKHAINTPDAPQQMAHVPAPHNHKIAAIVDALVRLYRR